MYRLAAPWGRSAADGAVWVIGRVLPGRRPPAGGRGRAVGVGSIVPSDPGSLRLREGCEKRGRVPCPLATTVPVGYLPPMSVPRTEIDRSLRLLREAPERIAAATAGVDDDRLHRRSAAEPWSVNDILAHLRASADMRETYIANMASGDRASLPYQSPRGWIRKTNYLELPFAESFAAYRAHRYAWLAQLETHVGRRIGSAAPSSAIDPRRSPPTCAT